MSDFGGIILFRMPDGTNMKTRGNVKHRPGRFTYEKVTNTDGSIDRTVTIEGYTFEMSLRRADPGFDYDAMMALDDVTFTFINTTEKVQRTFSKAKLLGQPDQDDMTGEITGITGGAEGFLEVAI